MFGTNKLEDHCRHILTEVILSVMGGETTADKVLQKTSFFLDCARRWRT